jgi:hypothetical protein
MTILLSLLYGIPKDDAIKKAYDIPLHFTVREYMDSALDNDFVVDMYKNKGLCLKTLSIAIRTLNMCGSFRNFREAVNYVITIDNRGSDTDTNASVSMALYGAMVGLKKMMKDRVTKDNILTMLTCDTSAGDFLRPVEYTSQFFLLNKKRIENVLKQHDTK